MAFESALAQLGNHTELWEFVIKVIVVISHSMFLITE